MFKSVDEPFQEQKAYRCPCCKYKTLHERGGFGICPVCWWEDDGQDEYDAEEVRGGPNGMLSLRQAQENFKKFGASDKPFVVRARKPLPDEL
jgi:hypothetical protein